MGSPVQTKSTKDKKSDHHIRSKKKIKTWKTKQKKGKQKQNKTKPGVQVPTFGREQIQDYSDVHAQSA